MRTGVRIRNKRIGITGLGAIHFSRIKNRITKTPPAQYSPMTIGEFQAYVVPPHSVGNNNAMTAATKSNVPTKSTFLSFSMIDDFGCGKCKKKTMTASATPPTKGQ